MITLRLWRSLNRIRSYSFHQRLTQLGPTNPLQGQLWVRLRYLIREGLPYVVVAAVVLLLISGQGVLLFIIFPTLLMFVAAVSLPLVPGTVAGIIGAASMSRAVIYEHVQGRYESIVTTTLGPLGLYWTLARRTLKANRTLRAVYEIGSTVYTFVTLVIGFLFVLIVVFALVDFVRNDEPMQPNVLRDNLRMLLQIAALIGVVLLLHFELIGSVVTGLLIGMLATTYIRDGTLCQFTSVGAFLMQQLLDYALLLLVLYLGLQALYSVQYVWQVAAIGGVFFLVRQGIVYGLLRALLWRLDADSTTMHHTI